VIRTRIAPTPSGFLHLGNVLSFVVTVEMGDSVLLRIDDMDRERVLDIYVQDIFDTLHFLDIPWDEGPRDIDEYKRVYTQVHRLGLYREALDRLRASGAVFACTCSRSQLHGGVYPGICRDKGLPLDAEGVSWRLRTDPGQELCVRTPAGVIRATLPSDVRDVVVRRKDGFPAYQLASLVDDLHYRMDLIVRGEDLWSSTLAQQYIALVLGEKRFQDILFYHHPLIVDAAGQKLSKSAGGTSIQALRKEGYTASEIYKLIGRLPPKTAR
jgi:glutamyl-tRNA synthetase